MATVEITQRALADLERRFDFIAAENPQKAHEQILSGRRAFELLVDHPLLGRSAEQGRRNSSSRAAVTDTSRNTFGFPPKTSSSSSPSDTSLRRDMQAIKPLHSSERHFRCETCPGSKKDREICLPPEADVRI
jgi:plasmid stabilization system protein ParE